MDKAFIAFTVLVIVFLISLGTWGYWLIGFCLGVMLVSYLTDRGLTRG